MTYVDVHPKNKNLIKNKWMVLLCYCSSCYSTKVWDANANDCDMGEIIMTMQWNKMVYKNDKNNNKMEPCFKKKTRLAGNHKFILHAAGKWTGLLVS